MTAELYRVNRPEAFWRLIGDSQATESEWETSTLTAAAGLPEGARGADTDSILDKTLGEGQFGPGHWDLSLARKLYYRLKPVLPRPLTRRLRQVQGSGAATASSLGWPIEPRYAHFLWGVVGTLLATTKRSAVPFIHFWPDG